MIVPCSKGRDCSWPACPLDCAGRHPEPISWLAGYQHIEWSKPKVEVKDGKVAVICGDIAITGFDISDVPVLHEIIQKVENESNEHTEDR